MCMKCLWFQKHNLYSYFTVLYVDCSDNDWLWLWTNDAWLQFTRCRGNNIISIPCTQHRACTDHGFPVTRGVVSSVMLDVRCCVGWQLWQGKPRLGLSWKSIRSPPTKLLAAIGVSIIAVAWPVKQMYNSYKNSQWGVGINLKKIATNSFVQRRQMSFCYEGKRGWTLPKSKLARYRADVWWWLSMPEWHQWWTNEV